jgi:hypothetical protein
MSTLAQSMTPAALNCPCGRQAFDVLYPWTPRRNDGYVTPFYETDIICPACRVAGAPPNERLQLAFRYGRHTQIRERVGLSSGTLLVYRGRLDDSTEWTRDLSMLTYWIALPAWDKASPLKALDLSAGTPPVVFVLLAALIAGDRAPQLKQLFAADWRSPERDYDLQTLGWNDASLKRSDMARLPDMTRLFREYDPETLGRPAECFRQILGAIRALVADGREPSQNAVATSLYGATSEPRNSVQQCIRRERIRSGRPWPWSDVVGAAERLL